MWTVKFWREAVERAVRGAAWYVLATVSVVNSVVAHSVPWPAVGYGAAVAFGLSVLASLVGSNVGPGDSPALIPIPERPRKRTRRGDVGHVEATLLIALTALVLVVLHLADVIR